MSTDSDLLNRYLDSGDQAAFAELLSRHAGMVHAAARRLAPSDADDIAQAVFILLLRKASTLRKQPSLAGWLYQTTLYCARNARRSQNRRDHHERQAPMPEPATNSDPAIRDLLDTALGKLTQTYRDVLLLRYLEGLSIAESAQRLGISPEAIEKRAERALAKLRANLTSAGHDLPAASLVTLLSAEAAHRAPANLLSAILAPTAKATTLAQSASALYTAAKLKVAATLLVGATIAAGGTIAVVHAASSTQPAHPASATTQPLTHTMSDEESRAAGNPALYVYTVGVEEPVAHELEKLSSPLPGDPQAYRLSIADAEKVRLLLRKEFIAGNVSGARLLSGPGVQPVGPGERRSYTGQAISGYRSDFGNRWGISSSSHFAAGQLTGTASGLRLIGRLETDRVSAADDSWRSSLRELRSIHPTAIDAELYPGEVLLAVLDLGTVGQARRCHLLLMHCTKVTTEQAIVYNDLTQSEHWLRLGPAGARMVADFTAAYKDAARDQQPDTAGWTRTLSDGSTVRFAALGLPSRWPMITWDPDGKPLPELAGWQLASNPADRNADSTFMQIIVESPHPIGLIEQQKRDVGGTTRYTAIQRGVWMNHTARSLGVRTGVGPWQSAGRIEKGATLSAGDARVTIGSIEPGNNARVVYTMSPSSDCLAIVGVAPDGTRIWPSYCTPTLPWGDSDVRTLSGSTETTLFSIPQGMTVDHFELLWRKAEVVQFDGFALEPAERPSFDLTRDYLLQAGAEPTRKATSRPALASQDLPAASMRELIAAAQKGDVAAAGKYLTGGAPEQRQLVAQMLSDMMMLPQAFQARYGVPLQGPMSQAPRQIQAAMLDNDLIADGPDSVSTHQIAFRRQSAGHWALDITSMFPGSADTQIQRQADILRQARQITQSQTHSSAAEAQKALDSLLRR